MRIGAWLYPFFITLSYILQLYSDWWPSKEALKGWTRSWWHLTYCSHSKLESCTGIALCSKSFNTTIVYACRHCFKAFRKMRILSSARKRGNSRGEGFGLGLINVVCFSISGLSGHKKLFWYYHMQYNCYITISSVPCLNPKAGTLSQIYQVIVMDTDGSRSKGIARS